MRTLNKQLGEALNRYIPDSSTSAPYDFSSKPILPKLSTSQLYLSRPPGGFGDELVEERLMAELDGKVTKSPHEMKYPLFAVDERSVSTSPGYSTPPSSLTPSNPFETYLETSAMLSRFTIQPPTPLLGSVPLTPPSSTTPYVLSPVALSPVSASSLSSTDLSRRPSFGAPTYTPSLTFSEPERMRSDSASTNGGSGNSPEINRRRRSTVGGGSSSLGSLGGSNV